MPEPKPYQCRHIFLDGHRCGSPSLRLEAFCYYHHATRRPLKLSEAQLHQEQIDDWDIPNLEDRPSIQLALTRTLRRLAGNRLHFQAAKLLIYGLQVASQNLAKMEAAAREEEQTPTRVEAIEHHPEQGPIAQEKELEAGCTTIADLKAEAEAEASGDRGETLQATPTVVISTEAGRPRYSIGAATPPGAPGTHSHPAPGHTSPRRSRPNPQQIKTLNQNQGVPQTQDSTQNGSPESRSSDQNRAKNHNRSRALTPSRQPHFALVAIRARLAPAQIWR